MLTSAAHATQFVTTITGVATETNAAPTIKAHEWHEWHEWHELADSLQRPRPARVVLLRPAPVPRAESSSTWRDLVQTFAYDAAEMPMLSRLLVGQAALALGYLGLRGALALRARAVAHRRPAWMLGALVGGAAVVYAWGALAFFSRTRTVPAITASLAYGHGLRQYFARRRAPNLAA